MQNSVIAPYHLRNSKKCFKSDKKKARSFRKDFQPLFIGSLTETNVDAGSPAIGPRLSQPADVIRC